MPSKRRAASTRAQALGQQSTLSFHGKQSKVTKPSQSHQRTGKEVKDQPPVEEEDVSLAKVEDQPIPAERAIEEQTEQEAKTLDTVPDPLDKPEEPTHVEDVLGGRAPESDVGAVGGATGTGWVDDEEQRARKISDSHIKRYWRAKEQERLAPRVHQEELSVYEKVLREWDMSGQYGPCIGIARLKRWKRANLLGLNPPIEVLAVLLKEMDSGDSNGQQAYVDRLMTSRVLET